jgi:hypothetical protein
MGSRWKDAESRGWPFRAGSAMPSPQTAALIVAPPALDSRFFADAPVPADRRPDRRDACPGAKGAAAGHPARPACRDDHRRAGRDDDRSVRFGWRRGSPAPNSTRGCAKLRQPSIPQPGSIGYIGFSDWSERWLGDRNTLPNPFEVDRDGDNRITFAELAARFDLFFTRFDANKDGVLVTRSELLTYAPAGDDARPRAARTARRKRGGAQLMS